MARPKKQAVAPAAPVTSERETAMIRNNSNRDFHSGDSHVFPAGETVEISNDEAARLLTRRVESFLFETGILELIA